MKRNDTWNMKEIFNAAQRVEDFLNEHGKLK